MATIPPWPAVFSLMPLKGGAGSLSDAAAACNDGRVIYVWVNSTGTEAFQSHYLNETEFASANNAAATAGVALSSTLSTPTQGFNAPIVSVWRHPTTAVLHLFSSHIEIQGTDYRWRTLMWSSPSGNGESAPGVPDWVLHGTIQDLVTTTPSDFGFGKDSNEKGIGIPYVTAGGRLVLPAPRYRFRTLGGSTFIVVDASAWTSDNNGVTWTVRIAVSYPATEQGGFGNGRNIVSYAGKLWWSSSGNVDDPTSAHSSDNGTTWVTFIVPGTGNSDRSEFLTSDVNGMYMAIGGVTYGVTSGSLEQSIDPVTTPRVSRTVIYASNFPAGADANSAKGINENINGNDYHMVLGQLMAGPLPIICTPPANDDWANSDLLFSGETGSGDGNFGTLFCATDEVGEPAPFAGLGGTSVWYRVEPTLPGFLHITPPTTVPTNSNLVLEVFSGATLATLVSLGGTTTTTLSVPLERDVVYYIRADRFADIDEDDVNFAYSFQGITRNVMSKNSGRNRLGCGTNEAYVMWKGGEQRFCPLIGAQSIYWSRILNDISEAEVVIPIGQNTDEACCECLGDIEPWCHELAITRDGETPWVGVITEVIYEFTQVTIKAFDLLHWTTKRIAEGDIGNGVDSQEWSEWAEDVLNVAYVDDDPNVLAYMSISSTGFTGINFFPAFTDTGFEQLQTLSDTGLDFTVVGRTIIVGPDDIPAAPIATLLDQHILGEVKLIKDGEETATRWFVHFVDDEIAVPPGPAVADADQQCYGLIERMRGSDIALYDADVADETAEIFVNATKTTPRKVEIPDNSRLSPETPWDIMSMIPGTRVDVALTRLCVDATQSFRLVSVGVRQTVETEEVSVTLGPLNVLSSGE